MTETAVDGKSQVTHMGAHVTELQPSREESIPPPASIKCLAGMQLQRPSIPSGDGHVSHHCPAPARSHRDHSHPPGLCGSSPDAQKKPLSFSSHLRKGSLGPAYIQPHR